MSVCSMIHPGKQEGMSELLLVHHTVQVAQSQLLFLAGHSWALCRLCRNDLLIQCWQGGDLCYLMALCSPPQCLVRAQHRCSQRHWELWEPSISHSQSWGLLLDTHISPGAGERQPARISCNDLGISPAAAVGSKWLEARDQRIDSILQLNSCCEIPARHWLEAPRQRGSIRVTPWAEGSEFSPSWFMAILLIGASQCPVFELSHVWHLALCCYDSVADSGGCWCLGICWFLCWTSDQTLHFWSFLILYIRTANFFLSQKIWKHCSLPELDPCQCPRPG